MAVVIASSSTKLEPTLSTITIDKPSGTVEGDLMVAFVAQRGLSTWTPPTDWTELKDQKTADDTNGAGSATILYKVAGASEGASYVFTPSLTDTMAGFILRITGASSTPGIQNSGLVEDTTDNASAEGTTITPGKECLLIMCVYACRSGASAAPTFSDYAIATSDPSWTELSELSIGTNPGAAMALAYASRPEATATGTPSATVSANSKKIVQFISVTNPNVDFSPDVLSVVSSVQEPTVTGGANVTADTVSVIASVQAPTVSTPAPDWTNTDKNSSSWTNQTKS